jgi:hypothetical protein
MRENVRAGWGAQVIDHSLGTADQAEYFVCAPTHKGRVGVERLSSRYGLRLTAGVDFHVLS